MNDPVCCFCGWSPSPLHHFRVPLVSTWHHSCDEWDQAFPSFCALSWTQTEEQKQGRPGNEAISKGGRGRHAKAIGEKMPPPPTPHTHTHTHTHTQGKETLGGQIWLKCPFTNLALYFCYKFLVIRLSIQPSHTQLHITLTLQHIAHLVLSLMLQRIVLLLIQYSHSCTYNYSIICKKQ